MRLALMLSVARRFMRSRSLARSTALMSVTAALLIGLFIAVSAFTLSGRQVTERDLGRFSSMADLAGVGTAHVGDAHVATAVTRAAQSAGARDVMVSLTSFDVAPVMTDPPLTVYMETDWSSGPFPDRYSLVRGRWPSRPGEVVLTTRLSQIVGSDDALSVLAGNERLTVVGVASDRFGDGSRILAAVGTWESFGERTRTNFPTATAAPTLFWNGGDLQKIITAVGAATAADAPESLTAAEATSQISQGATTKDLELARDRSTWVDRLPAIYRIPSLALPMLSVLAIFGLNNRRLRRSLTILRSIGMTRTHATASVAMATTAWIVLSTVAGTLVGIVLGLASRPICDRISTGPISPFPALGQPLGMLLAVTAVSCLLGTAVLYQGGRTPRERSKPQQATAASSDNRDRTQRHVTTARHVLGALAGCAVVIQVATLDAVSEAMIMAGLLGATLLLFTPELVEGAIQRMPGHGPRARLSRLQLANDKNRAVTAVAVLTAALGAPLGLLTLLATLITTAEADRTPGVAPHQVEIATPAGQLHAPPATVVNAITNRVHFDEPAIQTRYLHDSRTQVTLQNAGPGEVMAIDTIEQAGRLNNHPLTDTQAETLRKGGMLVWSDSATPSGQVLILSDLDGKVLTVTDAVSTLRTTFEPAWSHSVNGLLLTTTARNLGLPVTPGALVYTNVSDTQAAAVEQATLDAGLDPAHVDIYEPPNPIDVPPVFYTAVLGLALAVLATTIAVTRTQVSTLRSYLGQLISVGLSTRWIRQVLLMQNALIIILSTTLALAIAIPPVAIAALKLPFTVSIPWSWLTLTTGAFYLATLAAMLLSTRRLRPTDRHTA